MVYLKKERHSKEEYYQTSLKEIRTKLFEDLGKSQENLKNNSVSLKLENMRLSELLKLTRSEKILVQQDAKVLQRKLAEIEDIVGIDGCKSSSPSVESQGDISS